MFTQWWNQAGQIDLLTRQLEFAQGRIDRAEIENELLTKALKAEQNAHNKALRRYADQISKQVGLPQHFVNDVTPPKEPQPEFVDISRLTIEAANIRQADIDAGEEEVPDLEFYIEALKNNPSEIIIG